MATLNIYDTLKIKDPTKKAVTSKAVPLGPYGMSVAPTAPVGQSVYTPVPTPTPKPNPTPKPTVVAPAIKPTSTTLAPNDASYKYRADNGELNTNYSGYSAPRIAPIGSIASLYTDEEQSMLDSLNQQNEADAFQEIDPEAIYKKTLSSYQSQIDAINNIYNDQLTQSRITNAPDYQARQDENRIQQLMGGFGSSAMGSAQTNRVTELNNQEQASAEAIINDKRQTAIASIYGLARKSSEDELTRKYQAQKEGSKAVLAELNSRPEQRKKAVSTLVKKAVSLGYDMNEMSPEELSKLAKELKVNPDDLVAEFNSEFSAAQAEAEATDLKKRKAEADLAKTEKETSLLGKMTPYQAAQIGISQSHLKIAQDRAKRDAETGYKNFSEETIPPDVKQSLADDLAANKNVKGDEKKSLVDFFNAYPEVETEYLMDLFTNYNVQED